MWEFGLVLILDVIEIGIGVKAWWSPRSHSRIESPIRNLSYGDD